MAIVGQDDPAGGSARSGLNLNQRVGGSQELASARSLTDAFTAPEIRVDPDTHTRRWVSFALLGLLAAIVVASFVGLFWAFYKPAAAGVQDVRFGYMTDLLNIVFGPVIALVSSVVGFYFGAKTAIETPNAGKRNP